MKFAANPSVASKLVAPNSLCTITPNGAGKPVTKEIIANNANIITMGNK